MFCAECGSDNPSPGEFCLECGARLPGAAQQKAATSPSVRLDVDAQRKLYSLLRQALGRSDAGDVEGALLLCQQAVELDPQSAASHSLMAALYERLGDTESAAKAYERALELNPESAADRERLRALRPQPVEKTDELEPVKEQPWYDRALDWKYLPIVAPVVGFIIVLAVMLIVASAGGRDARGGSSGLVEEQITLGKQFYRNGQYGEAARAFARATQLDPTNTEATQWLAHIQSVVAGGSTALGGITSVPRAANAPFAGGPGAQAFVPRTTDMFSGSLGVQPPYAIASGGTPGSVGSRTGPRPSNPHVVDVFPLGDSGSSAVVPELPLPPLGGSQPASPPEAPTLPGVGHDLGIGIPSGPAGGSGGGSASKEEKYDIRIWLSDPKPETAAPASGPQAPGVDAINEPTAPGIEVSPELKGEEHQSRALSYQRSGRHAEAVREFDKAVEALRAEAAKGNRRALSALKASEAGRSLSESRLR